ncbi:hypothetical protein HPP92_024280 [Vanilla planifolia]|uniref:Uncharacterized protein n=1 Tax=Vanilla planifolia TaxID=51239 RepID=A0A835UBB2_VANPL|nr:hypothetical protein HPP92_024280 [Vanilla planifolia]
MPMGEAGGKLTLSLHHPPHSHRICRRRVIDLYLSSGLLVRILKRRGIETTFIDFAEFRRRVGKSAASSIPALFVEFKERRGPAGDPFHVLLCCWLVAVGAGLLKSEEIFEGVARLRISNDIEFEEETFLDAMRTAKQKRAKLESAAPEIPMVVKVEKAVKAIYVCCFVKIQLKRRMEAAHA